MPKYRNGKRVYGGAEADYLKRTSDERSKRNQARADAVKKGLAHKGDGKEVDHKTPLSKGGGTGLETRELFHAQQIVRSTINKF